MLTVDDVVCMFTRRNATNNKKNNPLGTFAAKSRVSKCVYYEKKNRDNWISLRLSVVATARCVRSVCWVESFIINIIKYSTRITIFLHASEAAIVVCCHTPCATLPQNIISSIVFTFLKSISAAASVLQVEIFISSWTRLRSMCARLTPSRKIDIELVRTYVRAPPPLLSAVFH